MPNWYENELRVVGEMPALDELLASVGADTPRECALGWRPDEWPQLEGDDWQVQELWVRIEPWGSRHRLVAVFFSADGPPTDALLSLCRRLPGLLIEDVWREGLMAEAGIWIARGGKVVADARGSYSASQMTVGPFGEDHHGE